MRVAILSDIHGNHLALEAVLNEASKIGVDYLFILGDLVGYYYHPDKVLELIDDWKKEIIQGNHEEMLCQVIKNDNVFDELIGKYGSGIYFAKKLLANNDIDSLIKLPVNIKLIIDDLHIGLYHGSPWDSNYYVYPNADNDIFDKCSSPGADFVFMGHTHYPFINYRKGTVLINVGSVGQARDYGGLASWAILDTENRGVVFKHTPYDPASLINEVKKIDTHLPYLYEVLLRT
jgi:putative phosphoesterase